MIESSLVLYNDKIVTVDIGGPGNVEFDFFKIWQLVKKLGEDFDPKRLKFVHVHPSGMLSYSQTDLNCVRGFKIAFKEIFNFAIVTFFNSDIDNLDYNFISYSYENNKMKQRLNVKYLTKPQLQLLKGLSYGDVLSTRE